MKSIKSVSAFIFGCPVVSASFVGKIIFVSWCWLCLDALFENPDNHHQLENAPLQTRLSALPSSQISTCDI